MFHSHPGAAMLARRFSDALKGARWVPRPRAEVVRVSGVPGGEQIVLGGGEMVPTPRVPDLPTSDSDRARGLCGDSLALPPAGVRVLRGIRICVGENLLRDETGAVLVENMSPDRLRGLPRRRQGPPVVVRPGCAALYGTPSSGTFEALVEALPSVLMLQHPALGKYGRISVLCDGSDTLAQSFLLERLESHQVTLERVPAGTAVQPARTLFTASVTRDGAGALPRWYRRWLDEQCRTLEVEPVGRRLLLTHGPDDPLLGCAEAWQVAVDHGLTPVDTLTGAVAGDGTLDAESLVGTLRDATLVLGSGDDALGHAALCRRAEIIHLGIEDLVSPRVAQLAASRALPYRFVRIGDLNSALQGS